MHLRSVSEADARRPVTSPSRANFPRFTSLPDDWFKVVLESLLAGTLLVVLTPLILLVMTVVKLTSRGPVIYSQVRVGLRGRTFSIYKIRTMFHDCERQSGPRWSFGNDSRVTPVGRILRRTHLDELPQLWNVIRGDMSLVGPRPERPIFVAELEKVVSRYRDRLDVRPGVTGLAQVQLPPDTDVGSVRRKVACDLAYIEQASAWLDSRILIGTFLILLHIRPSTTCKVLCLPTGQEQATTTPIPTVERSASNAQLLAS